MRLLAQETGLGYVSFDLRDPFRIDEALQLVNIVLNCASPFAHK